MMKSELISWPVTLAILVLAFGSLVAAGLPLLLTMAGLMGAGGGFLVVPALALLGGLSMTVAVGTSLLVIALNSAAALLARAGTGPFEWAVIGGGGLLAQLRADLSRTVEAEVRALCEDSPVPITFVTRLGRPADCLAAIADEVRADVVVVGVSRGWRRWCGVSVAAGLILIGRWPVVVVP